MVDYRLAPEHVYPAALDDCVNAYVGLIQQGFKADSISIIGDSCGGGLVLTTLFKLRQLNYELPACAISLSGWFDLASNDNASDLLYHQAYCFQRGLDYAGVENLKDPCVSPLYGDFKDLPAVLLQCGDVDPTSKAAKGIYTKACEQNGNFTLDVHTGMLHGFQGFANLGVPESLLALANAKAFIDEYCTAVE